ncbi:hypothetical protein [Streptomyces sp. NPDC059788]|uniref:hypothetical protein n=1 Tax=Streptomyces sp. NPDC059788 TaxID=3346948 RepID=UPI003665915F
MTDKHGIPTEQSCTGAVEPLQAYFTSATCPECQSANDGLNGRFACGACGTTYALEPRHCDP